MNATEALLEIEYAERLTPMTIMRPFLFALLLFGSLFAVNVTCGDTLDSAGTAYTMNASCTIDSVNAITISAENVTLDCLGFEINTTTSGVGIISDQSNTTIKNCIINASDNGITIGSYSNIMNTSAIGFAGISFGSYNNITNSSFSAWAYEGAACGAVAGNNISFSAFHGQTYGVAFDSSSTDNLVRNTTITSQSSYAINLVECGGNYFLGNNITSDLWVYDEQANTYSDETTGNIYYKADGTPSWTIYDITSSTGSNWADEGADLPFSSSLSGGEWVGSSQDAHPWTEEATPEPPDPTPNTCSGDFTPCEEIEDETDCNNQMGCSYDGGCIELESIQCADLTNQTACESQLECIWTSGESPVVRPAITVPNIHVTGTISLLGFMNTITGGMFGIGIILALGVIIFMSLFDRGFEEALFAAAVFSTLICILAAWMGIVSPLWIILFLAITCVAVIVIMKKRGN
jgi:hypothetical protein